MLRRLWIAVLFASVPLSAFADEWKDRLAGLDGIQVKCARANEEKYAITICDMVKDGIAEAFEKTAIPLVYLGDYFSKEGDSPPDSDKFARPLETTIFVRGTNVGDDYAINIRVRFALTYKNAIEQGSSDTPRDGELVFWETTTTGVGPRTRLAKAISENIVEKAAEEMVLIADAWPKAE